MKVWITGATGMVGKNLIEHPKASQYELLIPNRSELNLGNKESIKNWLDKYKPDLVIHAAGKVGGIQANIANPTEFLSSNLQIGLNVITSCMNLGIKKVINLGSSCMYPKQANNPLNIQSLLTGSLEPTNEGYALAKIICQRLCQYYSKENLNAYYKTLIPCNIYGKYDSFKEQDAHLVPSIIRKIHQAKLKGSSQVEIWGSGKARREFMYAEDLADAIWFCLENIVKLPNTINIGLGYDFTINEYYRNIAEILNYKGNFKHDLNKPEGMKQKIVEIDMISKLGWKHKTKLKNGIQITYDYFKSTLVND
tara:strand:- start:332 stop:1258 length:927 start_codon:yes stop_codon:yes gene_type:complete